MRGFSSNPLAQSFLQQTPLNSHPRKRIDGRPSISFLVLASQTLAVGRQGIFRPTFSQRSCQPERLGLDVINPLRESVQALPHAFPR